MTAWTVTKERLELLEKQAPEAVRKTLRAAMAKVGRHLNEQVVLSAPHRTGNLRRSLSYKLVDIDGSRLPAVDIGTIDTPPPYSRIREFGGTITPKRAKYLTIPTPENRTSGGREARLTAQQAIAQGARFFKNPKTGKLLIARPLPNDDLLVLFVLVRSVKQDASNAGQGYLRSTVRREIDSGAVPGIVQAEVSSGLDKVGS